MDVILPMPAFPLAAGPDSLLPLPGRLQLVVGPVLPLLAVAVVLLLLLSLLAATDALPLYLLVAVVAGGHLSAFFGRPKRPHQRWQSRTQRLLVMFPARGSQGEQCWRLPLCRGSGGDGEGRWWKRRFSWQLSPRRGGGGGGGENSGGVVFLGDRCRVVDVGGQKSGRTR